MIIEVKNLVRAFTKGKSTISAVNNISFEIEKGEFVSIVGKSGSGKSTLLNLLGGLDKANSGELIFEGKNIVKMSRSELAKHRRYTVGMIFQSFNLIPSRTAIENISLALAFGGVTRKERKKKAKELLSVVGLSERVTHTPDELSGGESQRVAIARALANNPNVLLADEPTGNLDSGTSGEILDVIMNLNKEKGKTVIMVTHDLEIANSISDRIITLSDGKIIQNIQKQK